ncbi:glycosyltransferase family 1 protein [Pedobacter africanus]|uniref:Glycosyltransferase involved in cell wall bisynthesis n=1 Tax=Pedobacter africanus TaxID=151894 RepID=A0A1W2CR59_9SPHI|nr:glycosyltransferase family 1 protein [Pedobacter africanus]SMC87745.1 Glycosyltransferase involved in cell wall bisynthesis [Pedobacter africanus]
MKEQPVLPANLICLSHLRWDFVYQRPQHLLTRFSKQTNVFFYEEPIFDGNEESFLSISKQGENLQVVVPHLQNGLNEKQTVQALTALFDQFIANFDLEQTLFWYYTPMALTYTEKHRPKAIVYDCMDELSGFKFAHSQISVFEQYLLEKADVVFTGGQSLYQAKKQHHDNIHPFPSSIEKEHFGKAKTCEEAIDQLHIQAPKIGFFGVIDERFDIELVRKLATDKPGWNIILIGPVVKIDPATLPQQPNIHYLGQKSYHELPSYLAGWDVAMIPFLLNESTRFISPTKTPEYLAAGIPVVSTPIYDVIHPYGTQNLVHICPDSRTFAIAIEKKLQTQNRSPWEKQVNSFLAEMSWDKTQLEMTSLICDCIAEKEKISLAS